MSPKKLHEVEILSGLIASYAKEHSIRSVIDLGAGQGYLSRVLAFQHHLCVLGVDSNTIQTCGAQTTQKRTEKLFVNKSKLKRSGTEGRKGSSSSLSRQPNRISRTCTSSASLPSTTTSSTAIEMEMAAVPPSLPSISQSIAGDEAASDIPTPVTEAGTEPAVDTAATKPCERAKAGTVRSRSNSPVGSLIESSSTTTGSLGRSGSNGSNINPNKKLCRGGTPRAKKEETQSIRCSGTQTNDSAATTTVEAFDMSPSTFMSASSAPMLEASATSSSSTSHIPALDGDSVSQQHRPTRVDSANDPKLATTPGSNFQLKHITHHITASTLPTLLKEHFPRRSERSSECVDGGKAVGEADAAEGKDEDEEETEGRWTLCGLHACGDLTSNMIKLYLESSATCLFSVGCCYNWITERFDKDGNIVISDGKRRCFCQGLLCRLQCPVSTLRFQPNDPDHAYFVGLVLFLNLIYCRNPRLSIECSVKSA